MPQINRIRVNNVKYNFGNQMYDDFVMRMSGKNTIYDLANGGGKSLLMLLVLQNLIPNCTLDDKQPIEKLFRGNTGNTAIHSMIEWKLDSCYVKDGFKYMTTGFCARKGRGTNDDEARDDAADIQASDAQSNVNASVEYFNYCIFYRQFGDNDLKNLPLSDGNERITYNGLKTYLRDLEKNDFGVKVKIFDRKGDYQNYISQFGLFESQWEIVRGINKTEGHVRTYFESNYRTSRKVVEDLLIEEIIQKSYNNKLGVENDEGEMAQTLIDIKDKLLELSKKHGEMSNFDSQVEAISEFAVKASDFKSIYQRKDELKKHLLAIYQQCYTASSKLDTYSNVLNDRSEAYIQKINYEQQQILIAKVMEEERSLKMIKAQVGETQAKKQQFVESNKKLYEELKLKEAANDYSDYEEYSKKSQEIKAYIDNRLKSKDDILNELRELAEQKYQFDKVEQDVINIKLSDLEEKLNILKSEEQELSNQERENDRKVYSIGDAIDKLKSDIENKESQLAQMQSSGLVLVADDAGEKLAETKAKLDDVKNNIESIKESCSKSDSQVIEYNKIVNRLEALISVIDGDIEGLSQTEEKQNAIKEKIDSMSKIYDEYNPAKLLDIIANGYKSSLLDVNQLGSELEALTAYVERLKRGEYQCDGKQYNQIDDYLRNHYGQDVMTGNEFMATLNVNQRRDVAKRMPGIEYGFVIKGDFDRIKADTRLSNIQGSSYIVPVISENIVYDTKLEINSDMVVLATKNQDFLHDDARLEAELRSSTEELENLSSRYNKLKDRNNLLWEDYTYVLSYCNMIEGDGTDSSLIQLEKQKSQKSAAQTEYAKAKDRLAQAEKNSEKLKADLWKEQEIKDELLADCTQLEKIIELKSDIDNAYVTLKQSQESKKLAANELESARVKLDELKININSLRLEIENFNSKKDVINNEWQQVYSRYYEGKVTDGMSTNSSINKTMDNDEVSRTYVESRFMGLKDIIEKEVSDVSDKETLLDNYKRSMDKAVKALEYKGYTLETIEALYSSHEIYACKPEVLIAIKDKIKSFEHKLDEIENEFEAQSALMNRIEGSVEHGIRQIEERYGDYKAFACDNETEYVREHSGLVEQLKKESKDIAAHMKKCDRSAQEVVIMLKDLERIITNAGIDNIISTGEAGNNSQLDSNDIDRFDLDEIMGQLKNLRYEEVLKEFDKLVKQENKRKDEFLKFRATLADKLTALNGGQLATEILRSVVAPDNVEETNNLIKSLNETNDLIILERDRIAKNIENMEKIKDSFENRCIQTCSNIKSELDRLPKLSTITMDEQVISIIGLHIPYVKEEFFKERMSSYINETVTGAESFKNPEERLRFIRNRLAWKRLFGVIVTDMNAVKINLYKRERIIDQSRYLPYEEAVGSTGQSQGIYIQFLIAIINYISSINADIVETSGIGKTIFIDNPFGAAKDIYIWEPIFKLLKTNHVQLIVPARGATPAITGRFDVNYILGQKMVDGRQQTVVVDYHSQIKNEEMEYTRLDFEQAKLDLF